MAITKRTTITEEEARRFRPFLTNGQAAELLGFSTLTVKKAKRLGQLRTLTFGGRTWISRGSVEELLREASGNSDGPGGREPTEAV